MVIARRTDTRTAKPVKQAGGYRGAEGRKMMEIEAARATARREAAALNSHMPFRFFCPEGETRQGVIIDDEPDFFRHEHCLKDKRSGKWNIFCECLGENANCPVDKVAERPSYFAMYLTMIDLEPYVNKDGEEVPWSKKLLVVKTQQQKKFTRLHAQHGSLRGMVLQFTRDGPKDSSIGNEIEFIEFMEEDELLTYETTYTDQNKKVHYIIGHEVFDYDELFPKPTEQQLRALVGGKAEPGSREADDDALGRRRPARGGSGDDYQDADDSTSRQPIRRTAVRNAAARGREIPPEDNPEDGADPQDDQPPQRATRASAPATRAAPRQSTREAAPPARTRPIRRAEPEDQPEDQPEDDPVDPPQRNARVPVRNTTRGARQDPEADDGLQRSAQSLAEKRRQLRG